MKTFLDLVLAGEARQDDIDDFVDQWHDGDASCSLAEFLGMSDDEYALWVEKPSALSLILQLKIDTLCLEGFYLQKIIRFFPTHLRAEKHTSSGAK